MPATCKVSIAEENKKRKSIDRRFHNLIGAFRRKADYKHDTKAVLDAKNKLRSWLENTPLYLQLQWFDTVECVEVSNKLKTKRWTTEITSRDNLYLKKLGVSIH